jgi:very-short-patch-repair endonuclease
MVYTPKRTSLKEANEKIKAKYPYYEVLEYNGSHHIALFNDCEYGLFKKKFSKVYGGNTGHPERSRKNKAEGSRKQSTKDKRANTCLERYGATTPLLNTDIINKIKQTNLDRYGTENVQKSKIVKFKTNYSKIKNGVINGFDGYSIRHYYDGYNLDCSYPVFYNLVNNVGIDKAIKYKKSKTDIEYIIEIILNSLGVSYLFNNRFKNFRVYPDFIVGNLIIEADGIKYHSDLYKKNNHHKKRKELFTNNGFNSLFFRENEIKNKFFIVKSIISEALGKTDKIINACDCYFNFNIESLFFKENHLNGDCEGIKYGIKYNKDVVFGVIFYIKDNIININRFCSKINTIVIGFWNIFIKNIINIFNPCKIIVTVDCRYESDCSFTDIGFVEVSDLIGFKWLSKNFSSGVFTGVFDSKDYDDNTGYGMGLHKIWDCGQKTLELELKGL